jgi:aminomethyltransferase
MSAPQITALYPLHLQLGAKMTVFADYQMPLQYQTGIIAEHLHCRAAAGFFDISHMGQCLIQGKNAVAALERICPSDLSQLKIGQGRYTVLTNVLGGIVDDVIVTRVTNGLRIVLNATCKAKDVAYLTARLPDCQITLLDECLFAVQGPLAAQVLMQLNPAVQNLPFMHGVNIELNGVACFVTRSGYTGEDGFEISVPNKDALKLAEVLLAIEPLKPIGLGARDTLRLEAGLSLYGHELWETITPVEVGLTWLIAKQRCNYAGVEKIRSQLQQGCAQRKVGLIVKDKMPVRAEAELVDAEDEPVGIVTSGSFSPTLNQPIALALLDTSFPQTDKLFAKVRDHLLPVTITSLPFVPHRYHRS